MGEIGPRLGEIWGWNCSFFLLNLDSISRKSWRQISVNFGESADPEYLRTVKLWGEPLQKCLRNDQIWGGSESCVFGQYLHISSKIIKIEIPKKNPNSLAQVAPNGRISPNRHMVFTALVVPIITVYEWFKSAHNCGDMGV